MVYYNYDKNKCEDDYQKLLTLYEKADDAEKCKLYGEILHFLFYTKGKKMRIEEPRGYDEYKEQYIKRKKEELEKYSELTNLLIKLWCSNLINVSSISYNFAKHRLTKDEFEKRVMSFFEEYFPDDVEVAEESFSKNKIFLKKRIIGANENASVKYFYPLDDYYIRILTGDKLNESLVPALVHELGHAVHFKKRGKSNPYDIFGELLSTLYEAKCLETMTKEHNGIIPVEQAHLIKKAGHISVLYNNVYGSELGAADVSYYGFDIIERLYAHIIYLTLFERGNEEYIKAINVLKENCNLEPFEQLAKIGITEKDLVTTAGNARKILTRK